MQKVLVWGLGIVVAMNNAGYDVGALLAGIGIGGLAIALAAQETVANVFGGITIYADRPFKIGDHVRVDGFDGFVQKIGIRSTLIQSLAGPIVVIPNKKFTESTLENVTDEPSRRVLLELGLMYETPPANMERAMEVLREIVMANQDIIEENHIVSFNTYKECSLNLLFIYFIRKDADIFEAHSRINLTILRRFYEEGLSFAYPTYSMSKASILWSLFSGMRNSRHVSGAACPRYMFMPVVHRAYPWQVALLQSPLPFERDARRCS